MSQAIKSIYLDNAATTFPKPESVYAAVDRTMREHGANPGRGSHHMAVDAARIIFEARETLADFFGIRDSSRISFMANATEAINTGLFGLLKSGDRAVTSSMEHNAVVRPLRALKERGVEVVKAQADSEGYLSLGTLKEACVTGTKLVVLSHSSNVTGTLQDIGEIGAWCRKEGILFFVDAAQSAGIFDIDVEDLSIDLLAVPGHKGLMGPPGTGFLYVREDLGLIPLIYGGTGGASDSEFQPDQMPERLESGTMNTPAIAGLKAGVEFLRKIGLQSVRDHETSLLKEFFEGLRGLSGLTVYGPCDVARRGGVVSFNLEGRDPSEVSFLLDSRYGICSRAGLHCAPDAHRTIGTFPRGTVRVSFSLFNAGEDMESLLLALSEIAVS